MTCCHPLTFLRSALCGECLAAWSDVLRGLGLNGPLGRFPFRMLPGGIGVPGTAMLRIKHPYLITRGAAVVQRA